MTAELLIASMMVLTTVAIHATGLALLTHFYRQQIAAKSLLSSGVRLGRPMLIVAVVMGLFVLHGLEIWAYAGLYTFLKAVEPLRTAVYVSTTAYGAIGYSESEVVRHWRLLPAIEGINGVLLIGWSTAFFVTTMERLQKR